MSNENKNTGIDINSIFDNALTPTLDAHTPPTQDKLTAPQAVSNKEANFSINTNETLKGRRSLFENSYNQGYRGAHDYAENYMMAPLEPPRFDFRRFMDDSIDSFVLEAEATPYIRGKAFREMSYKRKQQIKRILTVEEWDILNGTNFTSNTGMIRHFIGILEKLIDKGVFAILPEPQIRCYVIENGKVCHRSYGPNTENFKNFVKSTNTVLSEVIDDNRWICVKCSPTEPVETTYDAVVKVADQLGWISVG